MQALWRKLQAFDLVPEYKVLSSLVRRWFETIGALPFMEPGSVVDVWRDLNYFNTTNTTNLLSAM